MRKAILGAASALALASPAVAGEFGRFLTLENTVDVVRRAAQLVDDIRSIGD